jgi:hypothetical protein
LIINYYKNKTPIFQLELVDMKKGSEFIIIDNLNLLLNWKGFEQYNPPIITRSLSPFTELPRFILNNLISKFPLYTGTYTNTLSDLVDPSSPFLLYSYKSTNSIKLYQINSGIILNNTPVILSFKYKNKFFFLRLIPL